MKQLKLSRELRIGLLSVITLAAFVWSFNFLKGKDLFNAEQPTWTSSMYEVLSDDQLILRLLIENFPLDTEMEIYVSSNDCFSSIRIKCTLQEYIKREKIAFTY